MPAIAATAAKNLAALSKLKPPVVAKPAPPPPPPKPSAIVSSAKPQPNLGLYSPAPKAAAKPAPAPPPPKPEVLGSADGGVIAGKGRVVVDIEASDSGYDNKIYFSTDNFKTRTYIGIDNQTGSVDLGSFKPGTKIQFGIDNGQGDFFKTGNKAANPDKFVHAQTAKTTDGGVRIGFEDLRGGGDKDFNDAIIKVRSVAQGVALPAPPAAPAAPSAPAPSTPTSNDNRSGLGDGSNPGQGSGTANSPNQGTLNPGART